MARARRSVTFKALPVGVCYAHRGQRDVPSPKRVWQKVDRAHERSADNVLYVIPVVGGPSKVVSIRACPSTLTEEFSDTPHGRINRRVFNRKYGIGGKRRR